MDWYHICVQINSKTTAGAGQGYEMWIIAKDDPHVGKALVQGVLQVATK